jgi:hypothetical protein
MYPVSPSSSFAPPHRGPCSRSLHIQPPIDVARSSPSQGGSVLSRIPTIAGAACPSLDFAARRLSILDLCARQPLLHPRLNADAVPCLFSSTGVCNSFWSLKKSQRPWSGVPVTFSVIGTGRGNSCFWKSFCLTDNVWRGRRPVPLTADTPRLELLSFLHRTGDVENRAAEAVRVHWKEGTRNERTVSGLADCRVGRIVRESGMVVIGSIALPCDSCRWNAMLRRLEVAHDLRTLVESPTWKAPHQDLHTKAD